MHAPTSVAVSQGIKHTTCGHMEELRWKHSVREVTSALSEHAHSTFTAFTTSTACRKCGHRGPRLMLGDACVVNLHGTSQRDQAWSRYHSTCFAT